MPSPRAYNMTTTSDHHDIITATGHAANASTTREPKEVYATSTALDQHDGAPELPLEIWVMIGKLVIDAAGKHFFDLNAIRGRKLAPPPAITRVCMHFRHKLLSYYYRHRVYFQVPILHSLPVNLVTYVNVLWARGRGAVKELVIFYRLLPKQEPWVRPWLLDVPVGRLSGNVTILFDRIACTSVV